MSMKDADEVFVDRINTILLLFLGVLLVSASAILVTYSAVLVIGQQYFLMEFLKTVGIAAPLLIIGSGLLYYQFQKWKIQRANNNVTQQSSGPLCVLCEDCSALLYEGTKLISPQEIIERYNGRCPECNKRLQPD